MSEKASSPSHASPGSRSCDAMLVGAWTKSTLAGDCNGAKARSMLLSSFHLPPFSASSCWLALWAGPATPQPLAAAPPSASQQKAGRLLWLLLAGGLAQQHAVTYDVAPMVFRSIAKWASLQHRQIKRKDRVVCLSPVQVSAITSSVQMKDIVSF